MCQRKNVLQLPPCNIYEYCAISLLFRLISRLKYLSGMKSSVMIQRLWAEIPAGLHYECLVLLFKLNVNKTI